MRVNPTDTMPALDAELVGGGAWRLPEEQGARLAVIAFFHGLYCPLCRIWIGELDRLVPEFVRRGTSVIALTCDTRARAERLLQDWGLAHLRVGAALDPEDARKAGLYLSEGRGRHPETGIEAPLLCCEPGVLAVCDDGTLYAAWTQSVPYARPHWPEILTALERFLARGLPEPPGAA